MVLVADRLLSGAKKGAWTGWAAERCRLMVQFCVQLFGRCCEGRVGVGGTASTVMMDDDGVRLAYERVIYFIFVVAVNG